MIIWSHAFEVIEISEMERKSEMDLCIGKLARVDFPLFQRKNFLDAHLESCFTFSCALKSFANSRFLTVNKGEGNNISEKVLATFCSS